MSKGKTNYDCHNWRINCQDFSDSLNVEQDQHLSLCKPCQVWLEENRELVEATNKIVQFDVSEALTQKILTRVEAEATHSYKVYAAITGLIVLTLALAFVNSLDSFFGGISWLVSLIPFILLKNFASYADEVLEAQS